MQLISNVDEIDKWRDDRQNVDVLIIDFRKLKLLIPYMNQQLHLAKLFSLRCSRNFRSFRYESGLYPKCHT